jgi:transposase-like protein
MSRSKLQESPPEKVVEAVNDLGLKRAARKFNTSPSTLSRWLKAQNYRLKRIYVRKEVSP